MLKKTQRYACDVGGGGCILSQLNIRPLSIFSNETTQLILN